MGRRPGSVVHRQQQGQPGSPILQPEVVAPIQLEQHPFLRHPLPATPMLWWPTVAGAGQPGPYQNPPCRGPGQHQSLPLGQQLGQLGMVDPQVALLGQGHYSLLDGFWSGVGRHPSPVLMHQSPSPFFPIGRQQSPSLPFTHPQQRGSLPHRPVSLQHSIQDL